MFSHRRGTAGARQSMASFNLPSSAGSEYQLAKVNPFNYHNLTLPFILPQINLQPTRSLHLVLPFRVRAYITAHLHLGERHTRDRPNLITHLHARRLASTRHLHTRRLCFTARNPLFPGPFPAPFSPTTARTTSTQRWPRNSSERPPHHELQL